MFRKGRAWKEVQRAGGRDLGGSSRSSGGTRLARSMPSSSREWRFESARGECSALLPNKFSEFMQEVGLAASKQGPHTRQEDQGVWPQSINQQVRGLRQPPHTAGRAPEPALMWRLCYTCICWHASETEQTVAGGGCLREYMQGTRYKAEYCQGWRSQRLVGGDSPGGDGWALRMQNRDDQAGAWGRYDRCAQAVCGCQ